MRIPRTRARAEKGAISPSSRFAIAVSLFNRPITESLERRCVATLKGAGVKAGKIHVVHTPGAFELPLAALTLAKTRRYDAVIALGCVLRGETPHDRYIARETARGLGQAALDTGVPVILGVITPLTPAQARARSGPGPRNKGREAALAALEMAALMKRLKVTGGK